MSKFKNLSGIGLNEDLTTEVEQAIEKGGTLPDDLAEIFELVQLPYTGPDGKPIWVLREAV